MKRALFLSPHLDDVVFSCGATLSLLLERGWSAIVVTIFTGNVAAPQGFALQCQTSKGIAPEVDYMALRRAEDYQAFADMDHPHHHYPSPHTVNLRHWDFLEAPHRGYNSPPELFAGVKDGDDIAGHISTEIAHLKDKSGDAFDAIFAPQGLGNHVDHLHVIRAACELELRRVFWYRDTPYAIREPDARPSSLLPSDLQPFAVPFDQTVLDNKIAACCAYASQIGFQFGGPQAVCDKLTAFHRAEAEQAGVTTSPYAEILLRASDAPLLF